MKLPKLEFSEALKDSPQFRFSLARHERYLQTVEQQLELISERCTKAVETGRKHLDSFSALLSAVTDMCNACFIDDDDVTDSLTKSVATLHEVVEFQRTWTEQLQISLWKQLHDFAKKEVGKIHGTRSRFQKLSSSLDEILSRNAQLPKTRQQDSHDARNDLNAVGTCFAHNALEYVYDVTHFLGASRTYFHQGHDLFEPPERADACVSTAGEMGLFKELHDRIANMKANARLLEVRNQDRHALVPDMVFQHPRGMPTEPDVVMEGYLFKRGSSKGFRAYKRRWFVIRRNQLLYRHREPPDALLAALADGLLDEGAELAFDRHYSVMASDLRVCLVRPSQASCERQHCFELVTPTKNQLLQADSEPLCLAWMKALQRTIEDALHDAPPDPADSENGEQDMASPRMSEDILAIPGNEKCGDCGAGRPQWASMNLGVTLCQSCCGVHRSLSVQVSRCRSLTLDDWEPDQLAVMCRLGNRLVNSIYLRHWTDGCLPLKANPDSERPIRDAWIRAKYVEKRFIFPAVAGAGSAAGGGGDGASSDDNVGNLNPDYRHSDRQPSRAGPGPAAALERRSSSSTPNLALPSIADGLAQAEDSASSVTIADRQLFDASYAADYERMASAIAAGGTVNRVIPSARGRTALFQAIFSKSVDVVEYILLNGARVNVRDADGRTPLHVAVEMTLTPVVLKLLRRGADHNAIDAVGRSPLDLAVAEQDGHLVTLLRLAKLHLDTAEAEDWSVDDRTFQDVFKDYIDLHRSSPRGSTLLTTTHSRNGLGTAQPNALSSPPGGGGGGGSDPPGVIGGSTSTGGATDLVLSDVVPLSAGERLVEDDAVTV